MTTEDKLLLVQDLCARLPYGVQVQHITTQFSGTLHDIIAYPLYNKDINIYDIYSTTNFFGEGDCVGLEYFKPYLFPLSSMTGVEMLEYISLKESIVGSDNITYYFETSESIDWLNKNHFDYRGLIEKELAIDATGLNIY